MLPDSPRGRIPVKEKLTEMCDKAYRKKVPEKPEMPEDREKEETL